MRIIIALATALALATPAFAGPRLELHYSPEENLERIDAALIDEARERIDVAAYVLTDVAVAEALFRATQRGVKIRIFDEPSEERAQYGAVAAARDALFESPAVQHKSNRRGAWMHLKAYAVDGRLLRMGAANFSASGLKHQDNDLLISDAPDLVARFEAHFNDMWGR